MRLTARPLTAPAFALLLLALAPSPVPTDLRGFTPESAKAEREWETKFRALPSPDSLREYMRRLSATPRGAVAPRDGACTRATSRGREARGIWSPTLAPPWPTRA